MQASVSRDIKISKALSRILRHNAEIQSICIRADGFCEVSEVLASDQLRSLNTTRMDLRRVVEQDRKGRFQLDRGLILHER